MTTTSVAEGTEPEWEMGRGLRDLLEGLQRLRDRLLASLLGGHGAEVQHDLHAQAGTTAGAALLAIAIALVLHIVGALLDVPGGWGVEDFLGWVGPDGARSLRTTIVSELWEPAGLSWAVQAYLLLDTWLFVPAYGLFLIALSTLLAEALSNDARASENALAAPQVLRRWVARTAAPAFGLITVDLVENLVGLSSLHLSGWVVLVVAVVALAVLPIAMQRLSFGLTRLRSSHIWIGLALGLAALAWQASPVGSCKPADMETWPWLDLLGCAAHHAKFLLMALVGLVLLLAVGLWLFAALAQGERAPAVRQSRAEFRSAVGDMVLRSRYVLLTLALFGGLTLGLDQARDVLYAVAAAPWPMLGESADPAPMQWDGLTGSLFVYMLSGLAIWSLAFACWLWTRSVCLIAMPGLGVRTTEAPSDTFARLWGRLLGLLPYFLLVILCSGVISDSALARYAALARHVSTRGFDSVVISLTSFALGTVILGLIFVRARVSKAASTLYYNAADWLQWAQDAELTGGTASSTHKYRLLNVVNPYALPFVAMVGAFAARAVDLFPAHDAMPSMALAAIAFTLTLWVCLLGWLSMLEALKAMPYALLILILVGVLGFSGWTDNHRVWLPLAPSGPRSSGLYTMLGCSALLAALTLVVYAAAMAVARRQLVVSRARLWAYATSALVVAGLVLWFADDHASPRQPLPYEVVKASPKTLGRSSLGTAMATWLMQLCRREQVHGCDPRPETAVKATGSVLPKAQTAATTAQPIPVYFVSTEGGGIRAAIWTATVLTQLASTDADFLPRTFSISGVSGGSVGAVAFRACNLNPLSAPANCVNDLARADLVAPLLSAWLFEDPLARVLPTGWCSTPGCGFLSRSAWFETVIEQHIPGMRVGLWQSRQQIDASGVWHPYLLLNATWVETGERAIASDLQIDQATFPGAKDQLAIANHDLPLTTAAHNSARFPYINAIGNLMAPLHKCNLRDDVELHQAEMSFGVVERGEPVSCGHLADGGYFDNSGGQSSIDAMKGLARCLFSTKPIAQDAYAACAKIPGPARTWLTRHIQPTLVFIRNGVAADAADQSCRQNGEQPTLNQLAISAPLQCNAKPEHYRPERAACKGSFRLFVDALGPPITLFGVGGTGAHGRLSEVSQRQAVSELRATLRAASAAPVSEYAPSSDLPPPVLTLEQHPDGVRYPLGWHLSPAAVNGLGRQAGDCRLSHF